MRDLHFVCGNVNVIEVRCNVRISVKSEQSQKLGRILLNSGEIGKNLQQ